jgi:hypothetical protein
MIERIGGCAQGQMSQWGCGKVAGRRYLRDGKLNGESPVECPLRVRQRNWGQFLSLESLNIRNYQKFVEKLRYIHRNPVKAGLCERLEDWEWSSFRHYATGCSFAFSCRPFLLNLVLP